MIGLCSVNKCYAGRTRVYVQLAMHRQTVNRLLKSEVVLYQFGYESNDFCGSERI